MNLLGNLFGKSKPEASNYLSLVIAPDRVLATIWTFENNLLKTLGFGHKSFQNPDIITHQAALAIDSAGEQAKVDVSKTVFGLSDYFLEEGAISRSSAKTLKKLSTELDLDPQAFIPLAAGINHLLKIEESITPHAVLLGIFGDFCEVHVLSQNKVVKSISSTSPLNIEKLEKLVSELKEGGMELPSRIIVYGIVDAGSIAEKITKSTWKGLFIHEPKIDFLEDAELSRSIAYAQAADVLGYDPTTQNVQTSSNPAQQSEKMSPVANELGFIEGEDILLTQSAEIASSNHNLEKKEEIKSELDNSVLSQPANNLPLPREDNYAVSQQNQQSPPEPVHPRGKHQKLAFPNLFAFVKSRSAKKLAIFFAALIVLISLALFVFEKTQANAQVIIKVTPKQLEQDFNVKAIEGANYDALKSQIGAQNLLGDAQGSQKAVTTGSKKVGDPAKGQINVLNWTTAEKSFSKGTGIISKEGIKFTLDSDIIVASRSAATPGQSTTTITAADVGTSGNLDAGHDFTFQQYDEISYSANNPSPLTGGSERQATIVTQDDLDRLEKSLTDNLVQKAKDDLKNKSSGAKILDQAISTKVVNKQFDQKVGNEATLVNLNLQVEASVIVYNEDDLKKLLNEEFQNQTPQGLQMRPEDITFGDISTNRKDNQLTLNGKFNANLTPKFNEEDLKSKIAGKSIKDARAIVLQYPQVADVEINFSPNIPIIGSLPTNKSKISFKVETS